LHGHLGQLIMVDEMELPRPMGEAGGTAEVIERILKMQQEAKGKGKIDGKDMPPHMARTSFAGLQFDGEDVFQRGVSSVSAEEMFESYAQPITRSQKESGQYDPTKQPPITKDKAAKSQLPGLSLRAKPKVTEKIDVDTKIPLVPPQNLPQNHRDTRKRAQETTKEKDMPAAKIGPGYHFTLTLSETLDADALEKQILSQTMITLSLGQFLGASPEFQKQMNNLTKTCHEYTNKPVVAKWAEMEDEEECGCRECRGVEAKIEEVNSDDEEEWDRMRGCAKGNLEYGPVELLSSKVLVEYDAEEITEEEIEV
ncbi:hypothetical protein DXG01_017022, partial [Tephrocybe rancida]